MGPGDLHELTKGLGGSQLRSADGTLAIDRDPAVLVGTETGDDAGVYLLPQPDGRPGSDGEGLALVQTADFITPPFDDPRGYGRIAACNALSDVYAMGGRPITALNLCAFPRELDAAVAREILEGAAAALAEAGAALVGGHTVYAPELFFGLSVTGLVSPRRLWRNVGARPGDALILTKPLGAGLVVTAARKRHELLTEADRLACAASMATLNARAAAVLADCDVHAATDVTGFGLAGHGLGMTRGSDGGEGTIALCVELAALPLYPGARALAASGLTCGGAQANRRAYRSRVGSTAPLSAADEELIFDPQTSGGLLVALPAAKADAALRALRDAGIEAAARIGEVIERGAGAPLRIVSG